MALRMSWSSSSKYRYTERSDTPERCATWLGDGDRWPSANSSSTAASTASRLRSRRAERPSTATATESSPEVEPLDRASPDEAEPVVEPIQESALNVADAAVPAAEPAAEVSRPTITPEAVGSASVAVQSPDPEAQVVVSADANEVSPRNSEENLAEGKFVLISTGREVVNLTVSAETAKPEPVATVALATPPAPTVPALPVNPTLGDGLAIDLAEVDVEVTNANGVTGFAKKISAQLRNDNIVVKRITNHTSFQLVETVIEYQPGFENAAQDLISRTKLPANLVPAKAPRDRSDVRIFLGRDIVETLNTHFASTSGSES